MPIQIQFDNIPAGISLASALEGEEVNYSSNDYLSSEDGGEFVNRLDAIWGFFSSSVPPINPSQIDHFLAVIDRTRRATLYLNELQEVVSIRAKRRIEKGESLSKDDIATIDEMRLYDSAGKPIEIRPDQGVVWIHSVRFRKCVYYDLLPLLDAKQTRSLDMPKIFGGFHRQLLFQEIYKITDDQWNAMFKWGWFPFIWMSADDRQKIVCFSTRSHEHYLAGLLSETNELH